MSSVDNRIVILTFDNKDFESNVKTSLGTLDKLKNGLNLTESAKGLNAIQASAKNFSLGGMGDAIDAIRYRFSTLGIIGTTVISELTRTAMGVGSRIISAVSSSITQGGWNRALNIEQAKFQLEGLGVAWKDIEDDINYGVKDTAYGLDAAAKAASQLVASQVKLGDDMKASLRGISGVAAMTSSSYEDISNVFTRVAGQGRVMATDLNSLAARGLNAAATIGESIGKTEAEVRDLVSKGKIDFKTFATAMDDAFGQHAKDANKTFTGSLSNVKAALARIGADVAATQLTNLRDIFNELIPLINNIHEALGPFIDRINEISKAASEKLVGFLNELNKKTPAAQKNMAEVKDAIQTLKDEGFTDFDKLYEKMNVTEEEFNKMAEDGKLSSKKLVGYLDQAFGEEAPESVNVLKKKLEELNGSMEETAEKVDESSKDIEEAAQRVLSGEFGTGDERRRQLEELGYSYEEVQNKVNELLGVDFRYETEAKESAEATEELSDEAKNAAKNIKDLNDEEKQAYLTSYYFRTALLNLKESFTRVIDVGKEAAKKVFTGTFKGVIEKIAEAVRELTWHWYLNEDGARGLSVVLTGVFNIIKFGIKVVGKIAQGAAKVAGVIGEIVTGILELIGKFDKAFEESGRKAKLIEALGTVISKVKDILVQFKDKVVEVVNTIKNSKGFEKLSGALSRVWGIIKELAGKIFDKVVEKMKAFGDFNPNFSWLDAIGRFLSGAAGKLADFINALIDGKEPVSNFFSGLKESFSGLDFSSGVGGIFKSFAESVKNWFSGFSLKDSFSGLKSAIQTGISENVDEAMQPSRLWDNLKNNLKKLGEVFTSVDWGEVLKHVGKFLLVIGALRLVWKTGSFIGSLKSFVDRIQGPFIKPKTNLLNGIKTFSIAVGILAASLFLISTIPVERLKVAGVALGIIIMAIIFAMNNINGDSFNGYEAIPKVMAMVAFAGAVLILSAAVKKLGALTKGEIAKGEIAILGLMGIMALASKISGGSLSTAATFAAIGLAINLLVPAVAALGSMEVSTLIKAGAAITGFLLSFSLATHLAQSSLGAAGSFAIIALALNLLIPPVLVFGNMAAEKLVKAGIVILGLMSSLALATRMAEGALAGAGSMAIIALAVGLLIPPMLVFGNMATEKVIKAGVTILGLMMSLVLATKLAQNALAGAGAMAIMALSINLLIPPMLVFGKMETGKLIQAGAALVILMMSLAAATNIAQGSVGGAFAMLAMTVPLIAASIALGVLASKDWAAVLAAGTALSEVLLVMAAATKIVNADSLDGVLVMALMLIPIMGIAASLSTLAQYEWSSILAAGTALSEVLIAMSAAVAILSAIPIAGALIAVADLAIFVGGLTGIIAALGALNKIDGFSDLMAGGASVLQSIGNAIGGFVGGIIGGIGEGITNSLPKMAQDLSEFVNNLKPFLESAKSIDTSVLSGIESLAAAMLIITGADLVDKVTGFLTGGSPMVDFGKQLNDFAPYFVRFADSVSGIDAGSVESSANAAKALSLFADGIPNEGGLLAKITGDNSIAAFGEELEKFGPHLKAYSDSISGLDASAVTSSATAAEALSAFADSIPNEGGLLAKITGDNSIAAFGEELESFGPHLKAYADSVQGLDEGAVTASANAAGALSAFADGIPNEGGLLAKITGDNSIAAFGEEIASFGPHLKDYADSVQGLDESAVTASATAAGALSAFAEGLPNEGGLVAKVTGDNDLATFATSLAAFGPAFADYGESVSSMDAGQVEASARAATAISEFANSLENTGGLVSLVTGDNDIGTFARQLALFGPSFALYGLSVKSMDAGQVEASARAASAVAEFANSLDNTGGLVSLVTGDNDIVQFGSQLSRFGPHLTSYGRSIADLDSSAVTKSASAGRILATFYDNVKDVVGGKISQFFDGSPLTKLGEELEAFAPHMAAYSQDISEVDGTSISASAAAGAALAAFYGAVKDIVGGGWEQLTSGNPLEKLGKELENFAPHLVNFSKDSADIDQGSIDVVRAIIPSIVDIMNATQEVSGENLEMFGTALGSFSDSLGTYIESLASIDTSSVGTVVSTIDQLIAMAKRMDVGNSMSSFDNELKKAADNGIKGFIDAFNNATGKARSAGQALANSAASGVTSGAGSISFYNAGVQCMNGFINGMNSKSYNIWSAAYALADKAVQAVKNRTDQASPSKVFKKLGEFTGEGFVLGLVKMEPAVYKAGTDMADTVIEAVSNPLEAVADLINSDFDTNPVITPVLDLSNIQNGMGTIGSMMGGQSFTLGARMNAMNAAAAFNNMTTSNDDIVSAIKGMKQSTTTNNFTITVDGSENPEDFADRLVRRIKTRSRI